MFCGFCPFVAVTDAFVIVIFDIIMFVVFFQCWEVWVAKLLIPGGEKKSTILHLIDLDLRHSVFVNIIIGFQQIYC